MTSSRWLSQFNNCRAGFWRGVRVGRGSAIERRPEVIKEQKENRGSEVEQRVGVSNNSVVIAS